MLIYSILKAEKDSQVARNPSRRYEPTVTRWSPCHSAACVLCAPKGPLRQGALTLAQSCLRELELRARTTRLTREA